MDTDDHNATVPFTSIPVLKQFTVIFIPLFILVNLVILFIQFPEFKAQQKINQSKELSKVKFQKSILQNDLKLVLSDLRIIAAHSDLLSYLNTNKEVYLDALKSDLLTFAREKVVYDQIRYIDEKGMERVRINSFPEKQEIVGSHSLQNKADRYYFKQSISLDKNCLYISPLDLNIEDGEIEKPYKPMIRFSTPVYDNFGNIRGIIVLNYLGRYLLDDFRSTSEISPGYSMLLNQEGYWLESDNDDQEWGFVIKERKNQLFAAHYPEEWNALKNQKEGRIVTQNGSFTFTTVDPFKNVLLSQKNQNSLVDYQWFVISHLPKKQLYGFTNRVILFRIAALSIFASIVIALGSWYYAHLIVVRQLSRQQLISKNSELERALSEIKTLKGIVPICSKCKKIRDDEGYWQQLEHYVTEHTEGTFSHGMCPDCKEEIMKEIREMHKTESS